MRTVRDRAGTPGRWSAMSDPTAFPVPVPPSAGPAPTGTGPKKAPAKKKAKDSKNNLGSCAITQQLAPEHWQGPVSRPDEWHSELTGWTPEELAVLATEDTRAIGEIILGRLTEAFEKDDQFGPGWWRSQRGFEVTDFYIVKHDKDTRRVWDEVAKEYVTELKPVHVHVVVKFKDRTASGSMDQIATACGLESQYVEKPGRGRWAFDNMLSYLIHIKYPDKYQYDPSEVVTLAGRDYMDIYAERRESWEKGKAEVKKKKASENKEDLFDKIVSGKVTEQQVKLTDELFETYARYKREMDEAFAAYGERRAYQAAAALRDGKFKTQVLYLHGTSESGKTYLAKTYIQELIARAAAAGERWDVYRAATGNPLDDWKGEQIVLLDETRASAMNANDWLMLLDPNNASPAKARYRNKSEVAPRVIILTAIIDPTTFFFYARAKGEVDEALDQFLRRLAWEIEVVREEEWVFRYMMHRFGRVEPYTWVAPARRVPAKPGMPALAAAPEHLELTRGHVGEIVCDSLESTMEMLFYDLATKTKDVKFMETENWAELEIRARHEMKQAEAQKKLDALRCRLEAEVQEQKREVRIMKWTQEHPGEPVPATVVTPLQTVEYLPDAAVPRQPGDVPPPAIYVPAAR